MSSRPVWRRTAAGVPKVLSPREASARILEEIRALALERVPTIESVGRVAAESVRATVTIPPWNNASMDGYAVRSADVAAASANRPVRLPVVAEIPAGKFAPRPLAAGEAMRIMTGAPVPDGADSVVRIEDTDGGTKSVEVRSGRDAGRNVRPAGEDFRAGETLAEKGLEITPALLGVLLSGGVAAMAVHRRPKVAVISSGDELVLIEDFKEVKAGRRIVSTNSYTLPALVREAGGEPLDLGIAADSRESLSAKVQQARDCDVIVTSAGVSVGDLDYTRDVFESLGGKQKFWKVRIRPGAPLAFGMLGSIPWIGLPGNPVSAVVTFELFVRPVIRRMLGHRLLFRRPIAAALKDEVTIFAELTHFLRAVITRDAGGDYSARLTRSQSSASLASLASANALVVVPPDKKQYPAGSTLNAIPLRDYPFELPELEL